MKLGNNPIFKMQESCKIELSGNSSRPSRQLTHCGSESRPKKLGKKGHTLNKKVPFREAKNCTWYKHHGMHYNQ